MKKIKAILKYIFYSFLIFLVGLCCYVFVCLDILHKDYVNIFGYTYFVVVSGSMSGEIEVNDIVIVDITKDVHVDDIIAYKSDKSIVTHRLVQKNGNKYITKGDMNDTYDKAITKKDIIGKITFVLSPKFLLEFVVLVFIILIVLALLNFDGVFKKLFKIEDKEIVREHKNVLPQDIFCSPQDRNNFDEHSGLTITIPMNELKDLKKLLQKEQDASDSVEVLDDTPEVEVLDLENDDIYKTPNDQELKEEEIYNIVDVVLKVNNGALETTHLTKEWQKKYIYIYKLCLYIQSGRYDLLDKAINDVPFKEYFDYDIDKVGLYKELRNKIYDLPIYVFLKILFIAILYNDAHFFDGVFKILKYKVLVDKNNSFVVVKEKYDKKRLKALINFMERVSKKYNKNDNLDLNREKKLVDISNY
ncbi:MAG: signal peptidase I [Bacilli bacterium]|nr:signal peptidase I [Bacilli bacterium]